MAIKRCFNEDGEPGFCNSDDPHGVCYTYEPDDQAGMAQAKKMAMMRGKQSRPPMMEEDED